MTSCLHIIAGYKNDVTYLKQSYCKQPFKLANITEEKKNRLLRLMIMSSSPGVLDLDEYSIEICVEEDAGVHLTTQAYQRLFTMRNQASQHMTVRVNNNGSFCYLPHPVVPHQASHFSSVNNIYLQKKHHLTWSEIVTCGRKGSGEEFKFTRYHNVTNIYLREKLVVKENVLLEPLKKDVHAMGQLEGHTHQSTLLFMHDGADIGKISGRCAEFLSGVKDITFGLSTLPVNGIVVRILGQKSECLFNCNKKLALLLDELSHDTVPVRPGMIS